MNSRIRRLGIVASLTCYRDHRGIHVSATMGRVIDALARHYERVVLCLPTKDGDPPPTEDHLIQAANIDVIPQPYYESTLAAQRYAWTIARAYSCVCKQTDALFVRGLCSVIPWLYITARLHHQEVCHWLVGNSLAIVSTSHRSGMLQNMASRAYARFDRAWTRVGRWLTNGSFVCSGEEVADIFHSPRTIATVSSAISEREIFERTDTCQHPQLRFLFVGQIRPEKGIEYLIEALADSTFDRPWELELVGPFQRFPEYHKFLLDLLHKRGLTDRVHWLGHLPFGPDLFQRFREADIFVFPTLTEGTPHVLSEAMANSIPIITTNVGGIPTSITNGVNGIMVEPRDPNALTQEIQRVVSDGPLRRSLIREGLRSVRAITIERFVDLVINAIESKNSTDQQNPSPPEGERVG